MTLYFKPPRGIRSGLLWAALKMAAAAHGDVSSSASLPFVDSMPAAPAVWHVLDWRKRAIAFDRIVFDENARGIHMPLLKWVGASKEQFMIPSYVGLYKGGEAICCLAAVVGGRLVDADKGNARGTDWLRLSQKWFS
jgi:hypothetical protein